MDIIKNNLSNGIRNGRIIYLESIYSRKTVAYYKNNKLHGIVKMYDTQYTDKINKLLYYDNGELIASYQYGNLHVSDMNYISIIYRIIKSIKNK